jgi:metal-responsive CopG/Arc/MetJ family transcriptional regulator
VTAKKKASGRNIPEAERGTQQVKLRLPEDVAEDLDTLARRWKLTRSGAVARMVAVHLQSEGKER